MKSPLFLAALLLACNGCYNMPLTSGRWTPQERAAIIAALDAAPPNPTHTEPPGRPLITTETRFVSRCPYDGTLALSQSTLPSGGTTVGGTNVQQWSITYTCPRCGMMFSDMRLQILPDTKSLRLPLLGGTQ
jgi:hypothetical protein